MIDITNSTPNERRVKLDAFLKRCRKVRVGEVERIVALGSTVDVSADEGNEYFQIVQSWMDCDIRKRFVAENVPAHDLEYFIDYMIHERG